MNKNVGDGVTKAIILLGELLKYGKELLEQKLHPNVILSGYHKAALKVSEVVNKLAKEIIVDESVLKHVAKTALSTKTTFGAIDKIANIERKLV